MKKNLFICILSLCCVAIFGLGNINQAVVYAGNGNCGGGNGNRNACNDKDHKVTICHYPPGNPGNVQVISIDMCALDTHQEQHGDYEHDGDPCRDLPDGWLYICHTDEQTGEKSDIGIDEDDLASHLAHGDVVGACGGGSGTAAIKAWEEGVSAQ